MTGTVDCNRFDDEVDDLVLGQVTEPRRTALLQHAAACTRCADALAEVVAVTDRLLDLAPEIEPPVGFEQRVLGPRHRRTRAVALAAAAAVVVVAVVAGLLVGRGTTTTTAVLAGDGTPAGTVRIEEGSLTLVLDGDGDWPGRWACELRTEDGRWVEVGTWTAADVVDGSWTVAVDRRVADDATAMRVRSGRGDVLYTAALG